MAINDFQYFIKNYKCFKNNMEGFGCIKPINLIIGRNNSGKSSLIDLIEFHCKNGDTFFNREKSNTFLPELIIKKTLTDDEIAKVFSKDTDNGLGVWGNDWHYGKWFIGKNILISKQPEENKYSLYELKTPTEISALEIDSVRKPYWDTIASNIIQPLKEKFFYRLLSDRDIRAEEFKSLRELKSDGSQATNFLANYLNESTRNSKLIENTFLNDLNSIMMPDAKFNRILTKRIPSGEWEIFLEENKKGQIPLSKSGSGLKSLILVLIAIIILPEYYNTTLNNFVFGLEELENNLHPSLQRRLFTYIREKAIQNEALFFITTHSNVIIDLFSNDKNSQILHVVHNGDFAKARKVNTYLERTNILNDLEFRASDLLQSNCVIWVEGPTDRIYIKKWIEMWSNDELKEGTHYQISLYGGKLLSHYSGKNSEVIEEELDDLIKILNINRNSAIILDSDKKSSKDELRETKQRVINELGTNGFYWVTKDIEIENYLSEELLKEYFNVNARTKIKHRSFTKFETILNNIKIGEGDKYKADKVTFAKKIVQHFTNENMSNSLDLNEKMLELVNFIKKSNNLVIEE